MISSQLLPHSINFEFFCSLETPGSKFWKFSSWFEITFQKGWNSYTLKNLVKFILQLFHVLHDVTFGDSVELTNRYI